MEEVSDASGLNSICSFHLSFKRSIKIFSEHTAFQIQFMFVDRVLDWEEYLQSSSTTRVLSCLSF